MRRNLMSKRMLAIMLTTMMVAEPSLTAMAATLNSAKTNQTTVNSNIIRMDGNDLKAKDLVAPNKSAKLYEFKINPPKDGTYTDPITGFKVTVKFEYEKGEAKKVTFTSNYPVSYLLVKGGAKGGNLYNYVSAVQSDTEIITPDNKGVGHGHATFYYSIPTPDTGTGSGTGTGTTDPSTGTGSGTGTGTTDPSTGTGSGTGTGTTDPSTGSGTGTGTTDPSTGTGSGTGTGATDPSTGSGTGTGTTDPSTGSGSGTGTGTTDPSTGTGSGTGTGTTDPSTGTGSGTGTGTTDPSTGTGSGTGTGTTDPSTGTGSGTGTGTTDPSTGTGSGTTDPTTPVVQPLSIVNLSQTSGYVTGGDFVTINGTGFQQGLTVTLGGKPATVINYFNDTQIRIAIPQTSTEGLADLVVTNPDGQVASLSSAYTYTAAPLAAAPTIISLSQTSGLVTGGEYVFVNGTGFQKGLTVTLGGKPATVVNYYDDTQMRIAIPQTMTDGPADLVVTNPDGQVASLASAYTYIALPATPPPAITSLSQNTGLTTGGDYVTINGTGFQQGLTVKLGGVNAPIVNFYGSTSFRIAIPKVANAGVADLEVTNPDGQSVLLSGAYTYKVPVTTLTNLSVTSGAYSGGEYVFIYGTNFDPSTVVTVNNVPVNITYYSSTQLKIMAMPSGDALGLPITGGIVPIKITDSNGNSLSADFTYNAKPATLVPQITKISGAGGTAATGSISGGSYLYFYGTGFTSTMKVRIYNSSNILVSEAALTNFYDSTYSRYLMPKVTTAGTYTIKLVNSDGVESNGMSYIYY